MTVVLVFVAVFSLLLLHGRSAMRDADVGYPYLPSSCVSFRYCRQLYLKYELTTQWHQKRRQLTHWKHRFTASLIITQDRRIKLDRKIRIRLHRGAMSYLLQLTPGIGPGVKAYASRRTSSSRRAMGGPRSGICGSRKMLSKKPSGSMSFLPRAQ